MAFYVWEEEDCQDIWKDVHMEAYPVGCCESGHPRGEVDHISAQVINNSLQSQPPVRAPNAVGSNGVGEGEPEWHKEHPRVEVHPSKECTSNQYQCDGCKDELEVDHSGSWELAGVGLSEEVLLIQGKVGDAEEVDELVPK